MDHKQVQFEIKEISESGEFTGYASTFGNEDLGGDIIMPGAFSKTIKENPDVPVLWGHSPREVIGINQKIEEDSKGLFVQGLLNMDVQRAREARSLSKMKAVKGLSIGYDAIVVDWSREKEGIRILREVKLWEYSMTPFPMNPEAQITAVKSQRKFDEMLHQIIVAAKRNPFTLSAETKALMEQAISALQAAQAPEAAKHQDSAPEILHAMLTDRIAKIEKGEYL